MITQDEIERQSKRHCWSRHSQAEVYEAGFVNGVNFALSEQQAECEELRRKNEVLKQLLLLTHESVSSEVMNALTAKQWAAFIKIFPDEGEG
jgi:hypothetical protein